LPYILEKSLLLLDHLDNFGRTGEQFSLTLFTANLTFDIISGVVMDTDFGAQNLDQSGEFLQAYHELFQTYTSEQIDLPWFLTPRIEWKRRQLVKRVRSTLEPIVCDAFANRRTETTKSRSILSLSLQDDIDILTRQVINEACDQISTFLFAGHDTTSIMLSWLFYELSRTPNALKSLRDELDDLFGPGEQRWLHSNY
jgi:cytochrome P450